MSYEISYDISMPKYIRKTFSNQQLGIRVYAKLVIIMEVE
jgi:hypothetical protein